MTVRWTVHEIHIYSIQQKKRKKHKKDVINSFFFNYNSRITGGGGVGGLRKIFFQPFGPPFGPKIRGVPRAPPLNPPLFQPRRKKQHSYVNKNSVLFEIPLFSQELCRYLLNLGCRALSVKWVINSFLTLKIKKEKALFMRFCSINLSCRCPFFHLFVLENNFIHLATLEAFCV